MRDGGMVGWMDGNLTTNANATERNLWCEDLRSCLWISPNPNLHSPVTYIT